MGTKTITALLLLALLIAGCAAPDKRDESRPGGFYGGVSGGVTRP